MYIGYEAKRFFTNYTGLGNYCRFVIDALTTFRPEHQYYLYTPKKIHHRDVDPIIERPNVQVICPGNGYKYLKLLSIWRTFGIGSHHTVKDLKIFHGLSQELPYGLPSRIRKVVTVHDLIFIRYPHFYHPVDVKIYKAKVKSACDRADKIIAISQQTAEDLKLFLHVDESKLEIIQQGCHANFRRSASEDELKSVRTRYNLPPQYILNVGTVEERKNIMLAVKALAMLPENLRLPLVIVGRRTDYVDKVIECAKKLNVLSSVIFLHNVSFLDFPAIYQGAKVFVYPSLFEGFGIPILEAIESRVPVITSSGSCFAEAAGPYSLFVDPNNEEELADNLRKLIENDHLSQEIVTKSSQYIQKFQPDKIASDLHRVYTELV